MSKSKRGGLFLVAIVAAAASCVPDSAHAAFYPGDLSSFFRGTLPSQPEPGKAFTLDVVSGPCEFLSDEPDAATIESFDGQRLTVRIPGVPGLACSFPSGLRLYELPGLPAGNYRLDLVFYRIEQPGELGVVAGYIGGRDVVVARASPTPIFTIPAINDVMIVATALLFLVLALRRVRMQFRWISEGGVLAGGHVNKPAPAASTKVSTPR